MVDLRKPERFILDEYREWISGWPCACNPHHPMPSDPNHVGAGGMGTKESDLLTVPLCHEDHVMLHKSGRAALEAKYGMEPNELERYGWKLLARWTEDNFKSGRFK